MDAEGQLLPLPPQKGQRGKCPRSWRAIAIRNVAIEWGLCRSGRRRSPSRTEVRRRLRG